MADLFLGRPRSRRYPKFNIRRDIPDFLGFTHTCDKTRNGKFIVLRQTMRKRLQSKLREIKIELKRRLHHPVLCQNSALLK